MASIKMTIPALVITALALLPTAAQAKDECDQYKTSYDQTYCMAKLFLESDRELNADYNRLRSAVKSDVKQKLKDAQLEWIKYRDSECSHGGTIDVNCNYRVNLTRTEYLRNRVRECTVGTCRNEMITDKPWNK